MFGFGRKAREEREAAATAAREALDSLERQAGGALVRADERLRIARDEIAYGAAEYGSAVTDGFRADLDRAAAVLGEAYHLNQLLHDEQPDTDAQRHEWNTRILAVTTQAEEILKTHTDELSARRATGREIPARLAETRARIEETRGQIGVAQEALARLQAGYPEATLVPVAGNPDQATELLGFAERGLALAQQRLDASRPTEADQAARAAQEAVHRAGALADAVPGFELQLLGAQTTLASVIAQARADLDAARPPETDRIRAAAAALEAALAPLPANGLVPDPLAALSAVREVGGELQAALLERQGAQIARGRRDSALADAQHQVAQAGELIRANPGRVGPTARTRLSEAERELDVALASTSDEDAVRAATRAANLAAEATGLAREAIERPQPGADPWGGQDWGGGYRGGTWGQPQYGGRGGGNVMGGVLGGLILGGILDDLGDGLGDLFDD